MNTRGTVTRRAGDEIGNAEATPQGNRNAPPMQDAANEQVHVNPSAMKDGEVRQSML